jgi:hypothetical protein
MKTDGHPCRMSRHNLCAVHVRRGMLMCRAHWYMVPPELRSRINELWGACGGNILNLTPEYFEAVRAATDDVKARLELMA